MLGLKKKTYKDYDLRLLHHVRLSDDTWDGSVHPLDGWATDYYFCADVCIFWHAHFFMNGSRETRQRWGNEEFAMLLFELGNAFGATCTLVNKLVHGDMRDKSKAVLSKNLEIEIAEKLAEHPTWQKLVAGSHEENSPILISLDVTTGEITVDRKST